MLFGNSSFKTRIDRYVIKKRLNVFSAVLIIIGFFIIIVGSLVGIPRSLEGYNKPYMKSDLLNEQAMHSLMLWFVSVPIPRMLFVTTGLLVILFGFILKLIIRSIENK